MFTLFDPTMIYFRGEADLSNPPSMSTLQRNTKWLQEINFNKLTKKKKLTFYFFPNLFQRAKDSMFSLDQGVYKYFLTQENPFKKTLNPKITSLDFSCFSLSLLTLYTKHEE